MDLTKFNCGPGPAESTRLHNANLLGRLRLLTQMALADQLQSLLHSRIVPGRTIIALEHDGDATGVVNVRSRHVLNVRHSVFHVMLHYRCADRLQRFPDERMARRIDEQPARMETTPHVMVGHLSCRRGGNPCREHCERDTVSLRYSLPQVE
jgi:hypothetical protein